MNRHHLPRAARGSRKSPMSRLPRVLGAKNPIRALPLPFCFFNSQLSTLNFQLLTSCRSTFHLSNVPTFKPSKVQTIPSPRSHSRFGTHPTPTPEKYPPFFSCTYVEPILQPLCFQTRAWNGGYPPLHQKKEQLMNTTTVSPTSIPEPVAGPPKTEKSARAAILRTVPPPEGMMARADF